MNYTNRNINSFTEEEWEELTQKWDQSDPEVIPCTLADVIGLVLFSIVATTISYYLPIVIL